MKKNGLLLIGLLMITVFATLLQSCTKDLEAPVSHNITYVLTNNATEPMEFYITYSDPAYANLVHLNYDSIRSWQYTIEAQNSYKCLFNVYTFDEGADFSISIFQEDSIKVTTLSSISQQGKASAEAAYFVER